MRWRANLFICFWLSYVECWEKYSSWCSLPWRFLNLLFCNCVLIRTLPTTRSRAAWGHSSWTRAQTGSVWLKLASTSWRPTPATSLNRKSTLMTRKMSSEVVVGSTLLAIAHVSISCTFTSWLETSATSLNRKTTFMTLMTPKTNSEVVMGNTFMTVVHVTQLTPDSCHKFEQGSYTYDTQGKFGGGNGKYIYDSSTCH